MGNSNGTIAIHVDGAAATPQTEPAHPPVQPQAPAQPLPAAANAGANKAPDPEQTVQVLVAGEEAPAADTDAGISAWWLVAAALGGAVIGAGIYAYCCTGEVDAA